MIIEGKGNLLAAHVDALVNTVNTVGVMGKGVALQFRQAYPENNKAYEKACKNGEVRIGQMFVTHTGTLQPRLIINFPTKQHWRSHSKLSDIKLGLLDLIRVVKEHDLKSIAVPPLGCGLGGLRWEDVRPAIEAAFAEVPNVEVLLYAPGGAPKPEDRINRMAKPDLTPWRAALIKIVEAYSALGFEATHQEAQKLVYFLAEAGEVFRCKYVKASYGPYDEGMRLGLLRMEGHYVNGFGEGQRLDPVTLAEGAADAADQFLAGHTEVNQRIDRVTSLIEGFETPYGLELLATVHWVATREGAKTADEAIYLAHAWSPRKRKALRANHLRIAWDRLIREGWIRS